MSSEYIQPVRSNPIDASLFEAALTKLPIAYVRISRDGTIRRVGGAGLSRTDVAPDSVAGRNIAEILPDDVVQRLYATITEGPQSFKTTGGNGDAHWHFSHFAFYHQEQNEIVGIAVDVTDEVAAQEAQYRSEAKYRTLFENASDAIFLFELDEKKMPSRIVEVNEVAMRRLGYSKEEFAALDPADLDAPEFEIDIPESMDQLYAKGKEQLEFLHVAKDGTRVPVEVSSHLVQLSGKDYLLSIARDISDRQEYERQLRASLNEKEVLLQEIHHRVKNNLQIVSSMLSLEAGRDNAGDKDVVTVLKETQTRVQAMSLVHEVLYSVGSLAQVNLGEYLPQLLDHVRDVFMGHSGMRYSVDCARIEVTIDQAVPIALLVNEALTNTMKHGYPEGRGGTLSLTLTHTGDSARLVVADDGVGLADGISLDSDTIGMTLIRGLAAQLHATAELTGNQGTSLTVDIPLSSGTAES
ncbi:MAG: PAS domain S-box protein [Spirochaetes bacterium]|jgi:PAS domain S-box-containing protein|nr:PAS domain S-box protein [Spirochaetota bacterium]